MSLDSKPIEARTSTRKCSEIANYDSISSQVATEVTSGLLYQRFNHDEVRGSRKHPQLTKTTQLSLEPAPFLRDKIARGFDETFRCLQAALATASATTFTDHGSIKFRNFSMLFG